MAETPGLPHLDRPLNILMMLHMPWERNLGGPRVQLELAEEFQALGHQVEKFDLRDAFPDPVHSAWEAWLRPDFSLKAQAFVQAHAHRFDIIDAHQGNLPFSKRELGFQGLLVTRSVGLMALYQEFFDRDRQQFPPQKLKTRVMNVIRDWQRQQLLGRTRKSFECCDLINLPNQDEQVYLQTKLGIQTPSVVFPFGLSETRLSDFAQSQASIAQRLQNPQIAFIGTWEPRKGSRDWPTIVQQVRQQIPTVQFLFLGTGASPSQILAQLNLPSSEGIQVIPSYTSEELPQLIGSATIGAFPSYIEGFGFAVLEELACGLPTVAYDVPGPRAMLNDLPGELRVPVGQPKAFADRLVYLLQLPEAKYQALSQDCLERAKDFVWQKIALDTIGTYVLKWSEIQGKTLEIF